jgi:hypothetical protein
MEVRITQHAFDRFRERVDARLPRREMRAVIERMLAESVDLSGAALRRMIRPGRGGQEYWLHEDTQTVLVLEIAEEVEQITVLTVILNRPQSKQPKVRDSAKRHAHFKQWTWNQRPGTGRPYQRQRKVDSDE